MCKQHSDQLAGLTTQPTTAGKATSIRQVVDSACLLEYVLNRLRYNEHSKTHIHFAIHHTQSKTYIFVDIWHVQIRSVLQVFSTKAAPQRGSALSAGSYRASNQAKLGRIPGPISIFRPAPRLFAGAAIRPRHASLPAWTGSPASRAHFALGYSVRRLC